MTENVIIVAVCAIGLVLVLISLEDEIQQIWNKVSASFSQSFTNEGS